ncbi:MAG: hypothetical protein DRJ03_21710 [Chloroflexi bacterium]|nr:MAG: hypothetical protein DRI81_17250 [Chloroflexota bacterium]RLC80451.1 MAG: hypothetical protein DRJ03_21710 [Chloroflexota bacterium]
MDENESILWYRNEAAQSQRPYHCRKAVPASAARLVSQGDIVIAVRTIGGEWVETSSVAARVEHGMVQVNGYWYSSRDVRSQVGCRV